MKTIVAVIQMTSTPNVESNLACVQSLVEQSAKAGAKLVVLPEAFPILGAPEHYKLQMKEPYGSGLLQDFLHHLAIKNSLWIVGGTIPIQTEDESRIRSACIVYNDQGQQVARYDKIHLFDACIRKGVEEYRESNTVEPGKTLTVIDTPFGKLGLGVCHDLRYPEMFRYLMNQGAEIIAVPTAFATKTGQAHWEILARSRAIENLCYALYACQTGTHAPGRNTHGHSMIVSPWGEILEEILDEAGFITAAIDLEYLHEVRKDLPALTKQYFFHTRTLPR